MTRSVRFYEALGFARRYGGPCASFTSYAVGTGYLNLVTVANTTPISWWGRVIFYVDDVDELYTRAVAAGLRPSTRPEDAPWGERYFHIADPDGHELSFAVPLEQRPSDR
jgi:catechol 2,3-dioxygenase-like lactoylglutathione lyase family enzyme